MKTNSIFSGRKGSISHNKCKFDLVSSQLRFLEQSIVIEIIKQLPELAMINSEARIIDQIKRHSSRSLYVFYALKFNDDFVSS